jgi:hypothetical protein
MVHVAAKPTSTASSHPIKLAKLKLRASERKSLRERLGSLAAAA